MPSRVFIIEQPEAAKNGWLPDLSSAQKYGTLIPIFTRSDRPALRPSTAITKAQRVLESFSPADHILWTGGDPCGLAIIMAVLGKRHEVISFLKWENYRDEMGNRNGTGYYAPIHLNLTEEQNHDD